MTLVEYPSPVSHFVSESISSGLERVLFFTVLEFVSLAKREEIDIYVTKKSHCKLQVFS